MGLHWRAATGELSSGRQPRSTTSTSRTPRPLAARRTSGRPGLQTPPNGAAPGEAHGRANGQGRAPARRSVRILARRQLSGQPGFLRMLRAGPSRRASYERA
eukprot:3853788-Lingulodinium_polyedra.AAC.1